MQRVRHCPTLCLALALLAAGCDDEQVYALTPQGRFEPASIDFGEVTVGSARTEGAALTNTGQAVFTIQKLTIPMGFTLQTAKKTKLEGTTLSPGDTVEVEVGFLALEEGVRAGRIVADADGTEIALEVRGTAVVRRIPDLALDPAMLDFGVVEIGSEARRTVTVRNAGNAPGSIDRASLGSTNNYVAAGDEYTVATPLPLAVAESASAPLEIVFRPKEAGVRADRMTFGTGGSTPPLTLLVTGEGLVPRGDVVCAPTSVEFGMVERGNSATRRVSCTARGGPARFVAARLAGASMLFRLPNRPGTADLADGQSVEIDVAFEAGGLPMRHTEALLVDYNGGSGLASARVTLNAEVIPPPATETAISLKLGWSTNFTDVDIHLVRPGGRLFDLIGESDCFYGERNPDWNARGNAGMDDPFLDTDDTDGHGPEEINLTSTGAGRYEIYVHYFADSGLGRSAANVEINVAGQRVATVNQTLQCNQLWHVGTVDWRGTTGTFIPSGRLSMETRGSCN